MNDRFEQMFDTLRQDITTLRQDITTMKTDIAWIKGKLEGRAETRHIVLTGISIFVVIAAVLVTIFK